MKNTKTAASMEQTIQGAISGAIGGALIGSRRSLDDAVVRGMVQGAVTGALAGGAAAQATRDQRAHFGAGVAGGYLGSRGPRGESRPQVHVRMDRHNTGTPESFVTEKHAAAAALRRRRHEKLAEGNFGHGAELAGLAMLAAPSIQHFRKKPMSDRTSHKINAAGLAVLAAPSLLELAKRHKKTAIVKTAISGMPAYKPIDFSRVKPSEESQKQLRAAIDDFVKHRKTEMRRDRNYAIAQGAIAGSALGTATYGFLRNKKRRDHKKTASEDARTVASEKRHADQMKFMSDQMTVQRALGASGAQAINNKIIGRQLLGSVLGLGTGLALEHTGNRSAALGALLAGHIGGVAWGAHGGIKKQKQLLKEKGIDANAFGRIRSMTPEAQQRYGR